MGRPLLSCRWRKACSQAGSSLARTSSSDPLACPEEGLASEDPGTAKEGPGAVAVLGEQDRVGSRKALRLGAGKS